MDNGGMLQGCYGDTVGTLQGYVLGTLQGVDGDAVGMLWDARGRCGDAVWMH